MIMDECQDSNKTVVTFAKLRKEPLFAFSVNAQGERDCLTNSNILINVYVRKIISKNTEFRELELN